MGAVTLCPICGKNVFYIIALLDHLKEDHSQEEVADWLQDVENALAERKRNNKDKTA